MISWSLGQLADSFFGSATRNELVARRKARVIYMIRLRPILLAEFRYREYDFPSISEIPIDEESFSRNQQTSPIRRPCSVSCRREERRQVGQDGHRVALITQEGTYDTAAT